LGHGLAAAALRQELRDPRARVAEIAEMPRGGRAGRNAGRNALVLPEVLVIDAVDAERAFLHHSAVLVELACAVGTSPGAQLASDAEVRIDQHDAVLGALVGGAGRAHGHAVGLLAVIAILRDIDGAAVLAFAEFERVHAIEPHAPRLRVIRTEFRQRPGLAESVPLLAAHHAGVTPDARVEIDDERELLGTGLRSGQAGHGGLHERCDGSVRHARSLAARRGAEVATVPGIAARPCLSRRAAPSRSGHAGRTTPPARSPDRSSRNDTNWN